MIKEEIILSKTGVVLSKDFFLQKEELIKESLMPAIDELIYNCDFGVLNQLSSTDGALYSIEIIMTKL